MPKFGVWEIREHHIDNTQLIPLARANYAMHGSSTHTKLHGNYLVDNNFCWKYSWFAKIAPFFAILKRREFKMTIFAAIYR